MADKPLTAKSSIGDWLKHPVGGPLLRDLLAQGGQTEKALAPVRLLSLQRLVSMSKGQLPQEVIDDMVRRANGGTAPVESDDTEDDDDAVWREQITPAGSTVAPSSSPAPARGSAAPRRRASSARAAASSPSTSRRPASRSSPRNTATSTSSR